MDGKSKKITKKVLLYVLLIILALIWIVPIFTLVATALKHKKDFMSGLSDHLLPESTAWYLRRSDGFFRTDTTEHQTSCRNFRILPYWYDASNADSTGTNQHYLQQTESSEYIFRIILCLYRIWYFLLYPDHARFHARNSERYR